MAKGGNTQELLSALGTAFSGYGSALSGNPLYLQNALLMRQAQQQQQQQEQAQRQEQVSNIASRSLMRGGPMTDENKAGLLRLAAPQAFQSALAQQAMQQLFPQGFSGTVGQNEFAFMNGKKVAEGPKSAPTDTRPEVLRLLDSYAQMDSGDPRKAQLKDYIEKQTTREGGRETWSNPVAEIDKATGKPIQVRYGSLGGRKVEDGATPAKQGNAFDRQDYWRGQFKPLLDAATDVGIQSSKVGKSLDLNTGTGHIAAINALQKMIDQGAVVRDQDVALIQSAQSYLDQRKNDIERLKTGKLLGTELQTEMRDLAKQLETAIYEGTLQRINPYQPVMGREGVDMKDVLPDSLYSRFAPQPSGNFTMGAAPGLPNTMQGGQPVAQIGQTLKIAGGTATRIK